MGRFFTGVSNYDKQPFVRVSGYQHACWRGWENIASQIKAHCSSVSKPRLVIIVECYAGINDEELLSGISAAVSPDHTWLAGNTMKSADEIDRLVYPDVTDDEVFGYLTQLNIKDFFDNEKLSAARKVIEETEKGIILVYGTGASLIAEADILIYADMPRWEGQLRFRRNEVSNLGVENRTVKTSLQYKRAFFVDWRICDRLKQVLISKWDYVLDTVTAGQPKMVSGRALRAALSQVVTQPFRVVPFFDPGPWGGQWMKEVFNLDPSQINYAWCFDCVPEENSLLLRFGDIDFEVPSINLVFFKPSELLGRSLYERFGAEFPIRFDFLDTMDGGNLSLQVHPTTEYIREKFGMHYTQEESYYMLDAMDDASVYLGFKEDIQPELVIKGLLEAQESGELNAGEYVEKWPVKKHDHILIPPGTIHCSGRNGMVLEVSATPYIFTFKLWDWGRMGLDDKPRPINIEHGKNVLNWKQRSALTAKNLINKIEKIAEGDGWLEERTGLDDTEFIETRRHWFTKPVHHYTKGIVNVLNLVEGREAIVESPSGLFNPFVVHYAETFIIPAAIAEYTIRPFGESEGLQCATIKAFVRMQA